MEKDIQYTKLLKQQIATFQKEKRFLEFKSNYQDAEKLGRYISALSNGACLDNQDFGYLYFGVNDVTLAVQHTTFDSSKVKAVGNQQLEMFLRQMIFPKIDFQIDEFLYEGKKAKIGNLLTKMRKAGVIITAEKKHWKLAGAF
ncbi:MAG: ATP-binding protein [Prevotella sp.]|nr:ATP-binding protein [Prevotella sp.]